MSCKTDTITIYLQQNDVFVFYIEILDGIGGSDSVVILNYLKLILQKMPNHSSITK